MLNDKEKKVIDELLETQNQLQALKRDRSKFLKSGEVHAIYSKLGEQIREVLDVFAPDPPPAKVDKLLDDVFQLMSLALLTVGHNRKAPATYASLCTVQRLLEHLDENATFTEQDVESIRSRIEEIADIVERDTDQEPAEFIALLQQKVQTCQRSLARVAKSLETISPELNPVREQLVLIRRQIMSICSRPKYNPTELKSLKEQLREIEAKRVDGKFVGEDGKELRGQATVNGLLDKCSNLIFDFSATSGEDYVDPSLNPIYTRLIEMKTALENLLVTHRWTLRETDLYFYQRQLSEIDDMRVNGVFKAGATSGVNTPPQIPLKAAGNHSLPVSGTSTPASDISASDDLHASNKLKVGISTPVGAPRGQSILLYLLRRCYAIIYKLLESSEPVSEALTPIHNQLSTVRRCLHEVKRMGGLSTVRELYPYQMKLASIDAMRVDGKFMVGDSIPEGQGMLNALLSECFDLCHELRVEMDEQQLQK